MEFSLYFIVIAIMVIVFCRCILEMGLNPIESKKVINTRSYNLNVGFFYLVFFLIMICGYCIKPDKVGLLGILVTGGLTFLGFFYYLVRASSCKE